jgi:hypothetical protein
MHMQQHEPNQLEAIVYSFSNFLARLLPIYREKAEKERLVSEVLLSLLISQPANKHRYKGLFPLV